MSTQTSVSVMRAASTRRPASARRPLRTALAAMGIALVTASCDYVGLQPVSKLEARKEAEGKAIGGACRQAGRALEDCYTFNPQMPKASIFLGWREMNDYMMQNNLSIVRPEVAPVLPNGRARMDSSSTSPAMAPAKLPTKAAALAP